MRISLLSVALVAAAVATPAAAAPYEIDPNHTFITFEIGHFGASTIRGRFDKKEGAVELDRAAKKGKVDITFQIDSLNTGIAHFEKQLLSSEVLDAKQYPAARFVGEQFVFDKDRVVSVAGQLTLKGKSQPVTFTAKQFACYDSPILKGEVCGGDFEATIDRTLFGIDYGIEYGFPKNIRLLAQIEALKK